MSRFRWARFNHGSHPLYHLIGIDPAPQRQALCRYTPSEFWTDIREYIQPDFDRICGICFDASLQRIAAERATRGIDGTSTKEDEA